MRHHRLIQGFLAAIETQQWDRLADFCTPGVTIWHNVDNAEKPFFPYLPFLQSVRAAASGWRYAETGYWESDDRFFRQSLLTATSRGGESILAATLIIGLVSDGRISRIDEYYNSADIAPLLADPAPDPAD